MEPSFHYAFRGTYDEVVNILTPLVPLVNDAKSILDIGCGRGEWLQLLYDQNQNREIVGCDPNPVAIMDYIKEKVKIYVMDSVTYLDSTKKTFDAITCINVLEHLHLEELEKLIISAYDHLNPNGKLILVLPDNRNLTVVTHLFWLDPTHVRLYPRVWMEKYLVHVGFNVLPEDFKKINVTKRSFYGQLSRSFHNWLIGKLLRPLDKRIRHLERFISSHDHYSLEYLLIAQKPDYHK